ncbi:antitoxin VapB family protein [Candidatus Woesearchaeota archaeon]|nr:antitoxin VapB family protein [Candidatus Woesearchaeota archaeon]
MAVKTITITEDAYASLKSKKTSSESFTDVILRITKRRPLSDFFGVLSKETGESMEKSIMEFRKRHTEEHRRRVARIVAELKED